MADLGVPRTHVLNSTRVPCGGPELKRGAAHANRLEIHGTR